MDSKALEPQVQPRTEEGDFAPWPQSPFSGVALGSTEGGNILPLVLGAPQCPRKALPAQATR